MVVSIRKGFLELGIVKVEEGREIFSFLIFDSCKKDCGYR